MSVVGFDVGNESGVVAVVRQREIEVVLNDESKCETPAIVCFGEKQRFIGTAGAASSMMNPKNTVSQIKRFIGRKFSDPELQKDIKSLPFSVTEGPDGYPLIHAQYLGEDRTFTPTQILGMVLSDLKIITEKNLNSAVVDCCIGIPVYFTDLQRRAVIDAATIAGLHPLRLYHETTATALAYGIYKTDLPENEPMIVAFVDVGHASMQVCIAAFKKGQLKILAHSYDQCLGGRDFDEVLFHHFAAKFKEEYRIDVYQNARACLRLRAACEKLKKMLSANPEAPLNIECLMDEKDVRGFIKRDEFEQISIPILERVRKPLQKALADAGLSTQDIHSVEVVGSGSRVPAIIKILTEFFGKEPRRTMNASECVAKGSAIQCAILSPMFKVRDFQVNESFPFSIALSWKGYGAADNQQSTVVFPKGNCIPSMKALTYYRSGTFTVDVQYADACELQTPPKISSYTIGPFQSTKGEREKLKVKVQLNHHGIVSVESAVLLEEEEVEVPVVKEAAKEETKMETDDAHPSSTETDVNMQDAKTDGPGAENGVSESGDKTSQMETNKVEAPKKKVKKTNVPVSEIIYGGLAASDVQKAVEKEFEMALQDRVMEETKDKKNVVEAYVYDMRNKLHDKYHVHPSSIETDVNKQDAKTDGPGDENGVPESGDMTSQMEMFKSVEAMLEGLAMAIGDQSARTSAIEAKLDLIMQQIAVLGSRTAAEESTTLPLQQTMGLPTFDGSDPVTWLASADQYFLFHKTPMEKRVELALTALSGPAMSWIQLLLRRNPDLKWDQFTLELLIRFGSDPTLDGYEALPTPSQEGSLDDYIAEFEGRLAQFPELTEKQYLGLFVEGLKPHIRMQIRDPTITTYTAALQMAKHIDFVFKRM